MQQIVKSETEYCKLTFEYEADVEKVKEKRDEIVDRMAKTYEIRGFRKGKAPPEAIRLTIPNEVDGNLKYALANQAFSDVLTEEGIKPFGQPDFSMVNLTGNTFKCAFSIHTIPTVELKEYKGFDLPKFHPPMTVDELSQKILQELRMTHADQVPYVENDFVQLNDQVILSFKASFEDKEITELTTPSTILQVGKINIPGFDDNLLGMKIEETREFMLPTPEDFYLKDYAKKILKFEVKLIGGSKFTPAPIDAELAKKAKFESYEKMMEVVNSTASSRVQEWETDYLFDQIAKRLLETHQVKVPNWLALPEAKMMAQMNKKDWDKLTDEEKETQITDAEKGIVLSLVLNAIRDNEPDAQLTDEELIKLTEKNIGKFAPEPNQVMEKLQKEGSLGAVLGRVRDEFTLSFIVKNCNIVE